MKQRGNQQNIEINHYTGTSQICRIRAINKLRSKFSISTIHKPLNLVFNYLRSKKSDMLINKFY